MLARVSADAFIAPVAMSVSSGPCVAECWVFCRLVVDAALAGKRRGMVGRGIGHGADGGNSCPPVAGKSRNAGNNGTRGGTLRVSGGESRLSGSGEEEASGGVGSGNRCCRDETECTGVLCSAGPRAEAEFETGDLARGSTGVGTPLLV